MKATNRETITQIAKEFASGFASTIPLNGSGPLIVDPLSGYLDFVGYKHTVSQIPASDGCPQVLILEFPDGSQFIPTGADLKPQNDAFENWMWL